MNDHLMQPERAWQMALEQLRMEMPKASYDTWVQPTRFVSYEDGVLMIGTPSDYYRDWLADRLTNTLTRLMTGILNQEVEVRFVVVEEPPEPEDPPVEDNPKPEAQAVQPSNPSVLSIQAEYKSIYDEIVRPDQVIVFPGYFLRYIPLLGLELAWMYIGFRQAAYESGAARHPGKKVSAPSKKVARYSGMSQRTFWRWAGRSETWQRLRWLVKPVETLPQWSQGKDGRPHQASHYYQVTMTLPLTPFDERSLRTWLYHHLAKGLAPVAVLQAALETPADVLLPWPEKAVPEEAFPDEPHTVQEVIKTVCGPIPENQRAAFDELADGLAQHLMPPRDLVFLTHYFVSHWLPRLGSGPGWFVALMRDRGYVNQRTGEWRDDVFLPSGYAEIAYWLGLKRAKTVWEWLRLEEVTFFVREAGREPGTWEDAPRHFKICLGEPMTEHDQIRAYEHLAAKGIGATVIHSGASDTHREDRNEKPIGASVTHSGASDIHREDQEAHPIGAIVTHNGASVTHSESQDISPIGANVIHSGASDTHSDGQNEHLIGASVTHSGADDIHSEAQDAHLIGDNDTLIGTIGTLLGSGGTPIDDSDTLIGASGTPIGKSDALIGASDALFGAGGTPVGDSDTLIGASDIHNGANGTPVGASVTLFGASDTHRIGATGTLDWRDWHSFNSLIPWFKHSKNTETTTPGSEPESDETAGVVGDDWNFSTLLARNRVSVKSQQLLLENGATARILISWLLYAASPVGNGIRDPVAHAVSRLVQDPINSAGGLFDQLAGLPANELVDLLRRDVNGQSPGYPPWRQTMAGAERVRLRALAEQLGGTVHDFEN